MGQLIEAVRRGDAVEVEALLATSPSAAVERDTQGVSAIMHAAYARRDDLVGLIRPHLGPLDVWEAAALGDDIRLRELLDADARLATAEAGDGFPPLSLAAFFGRGACVETLLARGASVTQPAANPLAVQPLHAALVVADAAIVSALIDAGADVDARQQAGVTPLMAAAAAGSVELVRVLLSAGADPSLRDDAGRTAADWAADRGQAGTAAILESTS